MYNSLRLANSEEPPASRVLFAGKFCKRTSHNPNPSSERMENHCGLLSEQQSLIRGNDTSKDFGDLDHFIIMCVPLIEELPNHLINSTDVLIGENLQAVPFLHKQTQPSFQDLVLHQIVLERFRKTKRAEQSVEIDRLVNGIGRELENREDGILKQDILNVGLLVIAQFVLNLVQQIGNEQLLETNHQILEEILSTLTDLILLIKRSVNCLTNCSVKIPVRSCCKANSIFGLSPARDLLFNVMVVVLDWFLNKTWITCLKISNDLIPMNSQTLFSSDSSESLASQNFDNLVENNQQVVNLNVVLISSLCFVQGSVHLQDFLEIFKQRRPLQWEIQSADPSYSLGVLDNQLFIPLIDQFENSQPD
ncbi:hypothetical protein WICPIJ_000832 [Wickerhamomyces pijperi]|uniref:Uncharacterized protein n=1 Tax=Wickerhamomyces pijperi TaxID=599730 RepID=A0A9P8TRE8_WICPI|nr:hypothetical protein WICPIJ_000832 [Wickerhamomyces pijperi]